MSIFSDHFAKLANLQYFDYKAFYEDSLVSKEVCGFVLSLALIYNDIKNTGLLNEALNDSRPSGSYLERQDWGEYTAMLNFIDRISMGILHELFNLIKSHQNVLEDKFFKEVIKSINKDVKIFWKALVDTSLENYSNNKLAKDLMIIRNKISYHYDPKAISNGYKHIFENKENMMKAYISRGKNMPESRFYFADAAVDGCMQNIYGSEDISHFLNSISENLEKLNHSLLHIINNFITKRGYGFRSKND